MILLIYMFHAIDCGPGGELATSAANNSRDFICKLQSRVLSMMIFWTVEFALTETITTIARRNWLYCEGRLVLIPSINFINLQMVA